MVKPGLYLNSSAVNWLKPYRCNHFLFQINTPFKENKDLVPFAVCSHVIKDDFDTRKFLLKLNLMNTPPITITFLF